MERTQTWDSECRASLDILNPATGDIGVCTLWTPSNQITPHLDSNRINIVGSLRTASGLGWLLRGLYLHPAIRNLVMWGKDLSATGDGLAALWRDGITEDNMLPLLGRRLCPEMDRASVDLIRRYVKLWDWRSRSLKELRGEIGGIPHVPPEMESRSFPPIPLREQNPLPSRRTTFSVSADDIGDGWLQLLNLVMRCGVPKKTRGGGELLEILNAIVTIGLDGRMETTAPCFDCGNEEVEAYYRRLMDVCPEDIDYAVGQRMHNWSLLDRETDGTNPIDQLDKTIERLVKDHASRRGTVVLLGPTDLDILDDPPCIVSVTFTILEERLYATYVLRSDDIFAAWPLNVLSFVRLQKEVAKRIGVPADTATFISHSAYVYESDWGKAWEKLDKWFRPPLPFEPDPSGLFILDAADGQAKAMFVNHEVDRVLWEGESSDPGDLVRYIVDTMPWLARQHVRYLGEEAARMIRAMKDGTKYEQG